MTPEETQNILLLANAIDPRIQVNKPTFDLWSKVLHANTRNECEAAINLFYERYAEPTNRPTVDAPAIRRIIAHETERATAKTRALEPPRRNYTEPQIRTRAIERHHTEYQQGILDGNAERAYNTTLRETGDRRQALTARDHALHGTAA